MIEQHLDGLITLEDLAAWATERSHAGEVESEYANLVAQVLSTLRDAADPHRFRWEEPDLEGLLERLERSL